MCLACIYYHYDISVWGIARSLLSSAVDDTPYLSDMYKQYFSS